MTREERGKTLSAPPPREGGGKRIFCPPRGGQNIFFAPSGGGKFSPLLPPPVAKTMRRPWKKRSFYFKLQDVRQKNSKHPALYPQDINKDFPCVLSESQQGP